MTKGKNRVLIVTGQHFADSPRRVDLHFMAEQLLEDGDHVDFLVCRLSPISRFIKDGRYEQAMRYPANRWETFRERLEQFIWFAPYHPINLRNRLLNALVMPLYCAYPQFLPKAVLGRLPNYTHVVVESGPSPLLTRRLRRFAPEARFIYHAADRLETIGTHPCVGKQLAATIGLYDSVRIMAEAMRSDFPADAPVIFLPHGISKDAFDRAVSNPYAGPRHAVSVGDMKFDADVIDVLARANHDWTFHLFGKKALPLERLPNIVVHGEVPFDIIVPFIKHADVGLAPYRDGDGADYLSQSSLKMIQYSYCHLPIVAPRFAAAGRDHVCAYDPADPGSVCAAFEKAKAMDHLAIDTSSIRTWKQVVDTIFNADEG
ncbi:hypothetical protein [Rhizobium sp. AAP43]|uniref:GumK N-terminal domain-containing glycosyltransferase n=1 Tax=Rhizobium sp. AAP43 TaxID=1523420 RepID=UPI0006B9E685|nr:hypothetical protein [Rhizobium sp. AAP43]KPF41201.1 hypothetical protein IP76_22125 [Rhizobium sp. AAP43]